MAVSRFVMNCEIWQIYLKTARYRRLWSISPVTMLRCLQDWPVNVLIIIIQLNSIRYGYEV
jgi:hypothetical protein